MKEKLPLPRAAFDYDLSIKGQEAAADRAAFEADLPDPPEPRKFTAKSEEKRLRDIAERRYQGDRVDYCQHLRVDLSYGYRIVPLDELSRGQRQIRAASLKAAAERRTKRRNEGGTRVPAKYLHKLGGRPEDMTNSEAAWFYGRRPVGWWSA